MHFFLIFVKNWQNILKIVFHTQIDFWPILGYLKGVVLRRGMAQAD